MSRSTYIYVVLWSGGHTGPPIMARTVKHELISALRRFDPNVLPDVEVWRVIDDGAAYSTAHRAYLGTGAGFLAHEATQAAALKEEQ